MKSKVMSYELALLKVMIARPKNRLSKIANLMITHLMDDLQMFLNVIVMRLINCLLALQIVMMLSVDRFWKTCTVHGLAVRNHVSEWWFVMVKMTTNNAVNIIFLLFICLTTFILQGATLQYIYIRSKLLKNCCKEVSTNNVTPNSHNFCLLHQKLRYIKFF